MSADPDECANPHTADSLDDEGCEWIEEGEQPTYWHVFRCPSCGYVTEIPGTEPT